MIFSVGTMIYSKNITWYQNMMESGIYTICMPAYLIV